MRTKLNSHRCALLCVCCSAVCHRVALRNGWRCEWRASGDHWSRWRLTQPRRRLSARLCCPLLRSSLRCAQIVRPSVRPYESASARLVRPPSLSLAPLSLSLSHPLPAPPLPSRRASLSLRSPVIAGASPFFMYRCPRSRAAAARKNNEFVPFSWTLFVLAVFHVRTARRQTGAAHGAPPRCPAARHLPAAGRALTRCCCCFFLFISIALCVSFPCGVWGWRAPRRRATSRRTL